jgi:hypothetical protein
MSAHKDIKEQAHRFGLNRMFKNYFGSDTSVVRKFTKITSIIGLLYIMTTYWGYILYGFVQ